jgi:hypothetical protein
MTYKILNTRAVDQTVYTLVEYNFDGQTVEVEVAHFYPQSTQEIEENIINRAQSELNKLQSVELINQLLPSIELNQTKDINV